MSAAPVTERFGAFPHNCRGGHAPVPALFGQPLRTLSLFAGIGGFDLGLEATGHFKTAAFCEINPYGQAVLRKHWPEVPIFGDVRDLDAAALAAAGVPAIDAICGGFPCQDLSFAGKRAGIEGARSALWSEIARLAGELRPRLILLENVPGILSAGLGRVLGDLAALGYDAFWDCIPASDLGAHHRRDRWFCIAWNVANASGERLGEEGQHRQRSTERTAGGCEVLASTNSLLRDRSGAARGRLSKPASGCEAVGNSHSTGRQELNAATLTEGPGLDTGAASGLRDIWAAEPCVGRVADGVPHRTHRLAALGNAICPPWAEAVGWAAVEILNGLGGTVSPALPQPFQLADHVCQDLAKLPERHLSVSLPSSRGEG